MDWKGLTITITNQDGVVFATHNLDPGPASELRDLVSYAQDSIGAAGIDESEAATNLLSDLWTAAANTARQAKGRDDV